MIKKSKLLKILSLSSAVIGFVMLSGNATEINAQQGDPFMKPGWARPKTQNPAPTGGGGKGGGKAAKPLPPPVMPIGAPDITQRINYFKQMRLQAAENGQPLPKVTSVLTLEEMAITGIFRTPRGFAAMVEAKPIKLSYTIYPGEKFFDGQLVAIEENRLVFRKVTKMSNGKFIASVENKALRQYSDQEQIRGTAPVEPVSEKQTESANNAQPVSQPAAQQVPTIASGPIVSPLDEMSRQPLEEPKDAKKGKKPVKVAKNKK